MNVGRSGDNHGGGGVESGRAKNSKKKKGATAVNNVGENGDVANRRRRSNGGNEVTGRVRNRPSNSDKGENLEEIRESSLNHYYVTRFLFRGVLQLRICTGVV